MMTNTRETIILTPTAKMQNLEKIKTDGDFFEHINEVIADKIGGSESKKIVNSTISVMMKLPIPITNKEKKEFKKTGILVGKVQSGKTMNFTSLLSLAFDNGYKIGIIFGGITNELLVQNSSRIKEYFCNFKKGQKIVVLDTSESWEINQIKKYIDNNFKVIILTLKYAQVTNSQHMQRILKLFSNKWLRSTETMIIDDEGDQATLNSKRYNKSDPESFTHKIAVDIRKQLKKYSYISVTATPIANFLVKELDPLKPEFCSLIYPGEGYCGLSIFHGRSQNKYIRVIPEDEYTSEISNNDIWSEDAFAEALAAFYVGKQIRRARGDYGQHTMLIHTSPQTNDHENVEKRVNMMLNIWTSMAKSNVTDPNYKELLEILKKAYDDFVDTGVKTESFEKLKDEILNSIKIGIPINVVNSVNTQKNNNAEIFIGGNKIARGVTIEGLAVTYITRRAKDKSTFDSTEQRARWFGYKEKYLDVCRVWLTEKIKKDFSDISNMESHYWRAIEEFNKSDKPFSEFELIFENNSDNLLVSSSKAKTEKVRLTNWINQRSFLTDKSYVPLIRKFFENRRGLPLKYGGNNLHTLYKSISIQEFKNEIFDNIQFASDDKKIAFFAEKLLNNIIVQNPYSLLDVVVMREGRKSEILRTINPDHTFKTVESGSYEKTKGDRQTIKESSRDRIQIQINFIKPKNEEWIEKFESPVFYVHIPDKYKKTFDKGIKNDR